MRGTPNYLQSPVMTKLASSLAAAAITLDAAVGVTHVLLWLTFGYDEAPGSVQAITVVTGGVSQFHQHIKDADILPHHFVFPGGMYANENEAMVITLSDPGGTATAKISIGYQ